jgi:hypothetical protein
MVRYAGWLAAALILQGGSSDDAKARELVERSRAAVAAARSPADLASLLMRGRVRIPQEGSRFDEGQVEIKILLPDQFLRSDTFAGTVRISRDRTQFIRLMLGAAAYSVPDGKLKARATGEEAFDDTLAVDVEGAASFSARLVFDAASMIPMRLTYFERGAVSTVMSFADRRPVDGFVLPFRVTTQVPQRVLETLLFDEIVVNPPLSRSEFKR